MNVQAKAAIGRARAAPQMPRASAIFARSRRPASCRLWRPRIPTTTPTGSRIPAR